MRNIAEIFAATFVPVYCPGRTCQTNQDVADILNSGFEMSTKARVARLGSVGAIMVLWDGGAILHCKVRQIGDAPPGVTISEARPDETIALLTHQTPGLVIKPTKRGIRAEDLHLNIGPVRRLSTPHGRVEIDTRKVIEARRLHAGWVSTRSTLFGLAAAAEVLVGDRTNEAAAKKLAAAQKKMGPGGDAGELARYLWRLNGRELLAVSATN